MKFSIFANNKEIIRPKFTTYTTTKNKNRYIIGIKNLNNKEEQDIIYSLELKKRKVALEEFVLNIEVKNTVYVFPLPENFIDFCSNMTSKNIEISIGFLDENKNFKNKDLYCFSMSRE